MDILQPLPAENWTTLRDMMRYDWPKNIYVSLIYKLVVPY